MIKQTKIGTLNSYAIEPAGAPESVVMILHGYGADGRDLIDIGGEWQATLPDTVFISPDAPFPCEMSPMGRQWFSLAEYTIPAMEREIIPVWDTLDRYLDDVLSHYNLSDDRLVISGFSQGCMMALYALPRRKKPCAGVLGYSGRLLGGNALEAKQNASTPIRLIHGDIDAVVPPDSLPHAMQTLQGLGYNVTGTITRGLGHGIDGQGIRDGAAFIKDCLNAK